MTIAQWKVAIEDLGLPAPKPTDPPDGRDGDWFDAQTRFARRGFARLLVKEGDELEWFVDAAHPALEPAAVEVLKTALAGASDAQWESEETADNHYQVWGSCPKEDAHRVLVPLLLFADAVTADRDDLGDLLERLDAMIEDAQSEKTSGEDERGDDADSDEESDGQSDAADEDAADEDDAAAGGEDAGDEDDAAESGSPFETIGDDEPTEEPTEEPASEPAADISRPIFDFAVAESHIELGMGLPEKLDLDTFDRALAGWGRSLRGRYDVRTEPIAPDADRLIELRGAGTLLMLRVEPDALEGSLTVTDLAPDIRDHIETLEKVARGGIDPLVFLGVRTRASKSATSGEPRASTPFETIGDDADKTGEPAGDSRDTPPTLLIDDGDGDGGNGNDRGGMVLDLSGPPDDGAPLEAGRFDDPRLDGADATSPLVDVVLRHPGYSDRNIGQVLSILLSIDYSDALDLAASAPRVIAWSAGNERAQTMKTVIEGAGGKVHLVEPDTFPPR